MRTGPVMAMGQTECGGQLLAQHCSVSATEHQGPEEPGSNRFYFIFGNLLSQNHVGLIPQSMFLKCCAKPKPAL